MERTILQHEGQHLFVGLDVARKSWKVSIIGEVLEHKTFTQPPSVNVLAQYLKHNFPGARVHCAYEAGFSGYWIYEQLREQQIDCLVVNPADVPTKDRERAFKSDRIDARKIARSLRNGELDPIYVPDRQAQEDRNLVRLRYSLVRKQTRCKNQIKSLLAFYGIPISPDDTERYWSKRYLAYLESLRLRYASGDAVLQTLLRELQMYRQMISDTTRRIRKLAEQVRYRDSAGYLRSIPGISTLTAMTLLTELVDIGRFKTPDQLASYVGLAPGSHSSGEEEIETGLSHRRNPFLRYILMESAWIAARHDPALLTSFEALARRMPKQQAIVRIARKLLNRIRYVLVHHTTYTIALH
jgi:transposase